MLKLEKHLHTMLLMEFLQYELDGLEMGCSTATSKYECLESMFSVQDWTVDQLLDYFGFEYDRFEHGEAMEVMYGMIVKARLV